MRDTSQTHQRCTFPGCRSRFPSASVTFSSPSCAAPDGGGCPRLHFTGHPSGDLLTLLMQWTPNDILSLPIFPPPPSSYLDEASALAPPRAGLWNIPHERASGTRGAAVWVNGVGATWAQIAQRRHEQGGLCQAGLRTQQSAVTPSRRHADSAFPFC